MHRPKPPLPKGGASAPPRRGDTQAPPGYFLPNHSSLFPKKPSPFHMGSYFGKVPAVESLSHGCAVPAPFGKGAFGCTADTGRVREVTIPRRPPWALTAAARRPFGKGAFGGAKKCPLQRGLQRAGFYLESRSLSSASSEPLAWLKRPRSCSTVSLFFSSPATSTRILPSYIIIRRLP